MGYLQKKAAELLGFGLRTLQAYEKGERSPSFETAVKIADLYGCPIKLLAETVREDLKKQAKRTNLQNKNQGGHSPWFLFSNLFLDIYPAKVDG